MSKDPKKSITKEEDQFPALLKYTERVWKDAKDKILLKVDGEGLDEIFLSNMSDNLRQEYNCNCCKSFLRRYSGLVLTSFAIGSNGFWAGTLIGFFHLSFTASSTSRAELSVSESVWESSVSGCSWD